MRKGERAGLDIETDRSGRQLEVFYELYEKSMQRWSTMMHEPSWYTRWHVTRATPLSMLKAVAQHFGEDCTTWVAFRQHPRRRHHRLEGGLAGVWLAGSLGQGTGRPTRASLLLQKLAIEDACNGGCRFFDMGIAYRGRRWLTSRSASGYSLPHSLPAGAAGARPAGDRYAEEPGEKGGHCPTHRLIINIEIGSPAGRHW